ncbi:MAG: DUF4129 domain-containing protein, partial [Anaerolineales bacterium]|nr:DUF4129 domain-containing protein [Anaerolineales bacterium]
VTGIVLILAIPGGYLAGWLVELFKPMFDKVAQFFVDLTNLFPREFQETLKNVPESPLWDNVENTIKMLIMPIALMIAAYFLARALHRRMKRIEDETYIRESIGVDDAERTRRGAIKKPRPRRSFVQHFAAESIRRIYAALVARAAAVGLPRRVAETPYEFLPRLEQKLPEQSGDLNAITEAYVAVHYGELDAPLEQVNRVRAAWQRVERAMRASKPK